MDKYKQALDRICFNYGLSALDGETNRFMDSKFGEDISAILECIEKLEQKSTEVKPYEFEDLKKYMWIWDDVLRSCKKIRNLRVIEETVNPYLTKGNYIDFFGYNSYPDWVKFEDGRYYPLTKGDLKNDR